MDLEHEFEVATDVEATWAALTDVARVARCMPGTSLDPGTDAPYTGTVAVKVGAITVKFRGEASFSEQDDANHQLVMKCEGAEIRGASSASASIKMMLDELSDNRTRVRVRTSLQLSGKVAQFGRGMIQDVSNAILRKFVSNLEADLGHGPAQSAASAGDVANHRQSNSSPNDFGATANSIHSSMSRNDEVFDIGAAALPALWARYGPTVLSAGAMVISLWALSRSRNSSRRCRMPYY